MRCARSGCSRRRLQTPWWPAAASPTPIAAMTRRMAATIAAAARARTVRRRARRPPPRRLFSSPFGGSVGAGPRFGPALLRTTAFVIRTLTRERGHGNDGDYRRPGEEAPRRDRRGDD